MKRWAWSYVVDASLLLALCVLFFWRDLTLVTANHRSFATGDFANQFYAFARFEAARLQTGRLPLWNPYTYAGHPFQADVQSAVFYPIRLLNVALGASRGFSYFALELEALLHFPLVAVSTYLLARRLTRSRLGGLVAAITFTFSGYLTSYPPLQLAILEVAAWLPLILLCLLLAADHLRAARPRSGLRWTVLAGLLLGLSLLAGHPQTSLLVVYGSLAFAAFLLLPRPPGQAPRAWLSGAGALAIFLLAGAAVAAVQLLPSWEFMRQATRAGLAFDEAGSGFTPYDLLQLVFPQVATPFPALYFGILPLGLAALGLLRGARPANFVDDLHRPLTGFLGWGACLSLLLSFGKLLPVFALFYLVVPGWSLFRHQERSIVWAVLAVSLLAGYGAAWLVCQPKAGERWLVRSYGLAGLAAAGLALVFFVGYQAGQQALWGFTAAALFVALLAALSALAIRSGSAFLLLFVVIVDLFTLNNSQHAGPAGWVDPFPAQPLLAVPLADNSPFRIDNDGRLPENYGAVYGLEDLGGASPLQLASYRQLLDRLPRPRVWQLLNVKYALTARSALEVPAQLVGEMPGADGQTSYLFRLTDPRPRAWLTGQVVIEPDAERLWQRLAASDFDPTRQALLAAQPAGAPLDPACQGDLTWQERSAESLALQARPSANCLLVLSELDYPGWQATVDGRPTPILRANGALRALALEPGSHQVIMRFRPLTLTAGAVISGAALLLALGWLILSRPKPLLEPRRLSATPAPEPASSCPPGCHTHPGLHSPV